MRQHSERRRVGRKGSMWDNRVELGWGGEGVDRVRRSRA